MKKAAVLILALALLIPVICFAYNHCPNHPTAGYHIRNDGALWADPKDSQSHYIVYNYYVICDVCNEEIDRYTATDGTTAPHHFQNGVCTDCGYVRGSTVDTPSTKKPGPRTKPTTRTLYTLVDGQWPQKRYSGVGTGLTSGANRENRKQAYFGPDKEDYPGAGAYTAYEVYSATAWFAENGFVFVDISSNVGQRCTYFPDYCLTNSSVAEESFSVAYRAYTSSQVQPSYGPGSNYDRVSQKKSSGSKISVILPAGTEVAVFFEMNGWVFAEFNCSLGLIRAWLPTSVL